MSRDSEGPVGEQERRLLGAWLASPATFYQTQALVSAEDFASEFHQHVFRAIAAVAENGEAFDAVTIGNALLTKRADAIGYLAQAQVDCLAPENAEGYAEIVRAKSQQRKALAMLRDAAKSLATGDTTPLHALPAELEQLMQGPATYSDFKAVLKSALDLADETAELREQGQLGATFGIPCVDRALGGLYGPRLLILAARPSVGKTALALQMALHTANHGKPVGVCSLEMSREELGQRSLSNWLGINLSDIVKGTDEGRERVVAKWPESGRNLESLPIYTDDQCFNLGQIVGRISEWKRKHDIQVAIVDHLQLVGGGSGDNRNEKLGHVTRTLKLLAKRLNMPIVVLCQLSRLVEREQREPNMSDLRDSGNIEQDADYVLALHGSSEAVSGSLHGQECKQRPIKFLFLKNRTGPQGAPTKRVHFVGAYQTFIELDDYAY